MRDALLMLLRPVGIEGSLRPIVRRYVWAMPAVVGLAFLANLLEGCGISMLIPLVSTLLSTAPSDLPGPLSLISNFINQFEPSRRLLVAGSIILSFVLAKGVVQVGYGSLIGWVEGRISDELRRALATQLLTVGYPFHLQTSSSRLLNVLTREVWRVADAIRFGFMGVVAMTGVVVFGLLMVSLNFKLMIAVALGVGVIRGVQHLFVLGAHPISKRVTESNGRLSQLMMRVVQANRLIRVFNQEPREQAQFAAASNVVRRNMLRADVHKAFAGSVLEVSYSVLFISVLLGSYFAGVNLPSLVGFLLLLYRSQPFLKDLANTHLALATLRGSVKEVEWLLDKETKPGPPTGTRKLEHVTSGIVFEDVSFGYDDESRDTPALSNASFKLDGGRTIALIGRSGSGKSTVINLLCRLLEPTSGRILVNGIPLNEIDPANWRDRLGFAGQDAELIDGTLADNIAYGLNGATRDDVIAAAKLSDVHEFIQSLPNGYDTEVGLGGMGLSGGQRQRIGLARALIRQPDILILDEATSAVDGISEAAILGLLQACPWKATTLVVSHRASTLASCDDGVVLAGGKVVESGPLARLEGYKQMTVGETA